MDRVVPKSEPKAFRNWDKAFTRSELSQTYLYWAGRSTPRDSWPFQVSQYEQSEIQFAAYGSEKEPNFAWGWQLFRVMLKGLPTAEKLGMLYARYMQSRSNPDFRERRVEGIRIDNYILALRRGGQLDADYKVVK